MFDATPPSNLPVNPRPVLGVSVRIPRRHVRRPAGLPRQTLVIPRVPKSWLSDNPYHLFRGERTLFGAMPIAVITDQGADAFLVINSRLAFALGVREFVRRYAPLEGDPEAIERWIGAVEDGFFGYSFDGGNVVVRGFADFWRGTEPLRTIDSNFIGFFDARYQTWTDESSPAYQGPRYAERLAIITLRAPAPRRAR